MQKNAGTHLDVLPVFLEQGGQEVGGKLHVELDLVLGLLHVGNGHREAHHLGANVGVGFGDNVLSRKILHLARCRRCKCRGATVPGSVCGLHDKCYTDVKCVIYRRQKKLIL